MIGYCTYWHKEVLSEADCVYCKHVDCYGDTTSCGYWSYWYRDLTFKHEIIRLYYKYLNKYLNWYRFKFRRR